MGQKSHPTSDQLERFVLGRTGAEENRAIVRHLLASCPECGKVTGALVALPEEIRTMRRQP